MATYGPHGRKADQWWSGNPTTGPVGTATTWVGQQYGFAVDGRIAGFRLYAEAGIDGNYVVVLQEVLASETRAAYLFRARSPMTSSGWTQVWLRPWYRIATAPDYRVWVQYVGGHYFRTNSLLSSPVQHGDIVNIGGMQSTAICPWVTTPTTNTNANAIDVLFQPD